MNIPASAENVSPLQEGARVPDVMLTTVEDSPVALHSLLERPVILVFYRGGWCPYCNLQLSGLQTIVKDLDEMGVRILAVSPDRPEKLRESLEKEALSYTLLSDSSMDAAKAFGIAFRVDDETVEKYKGFGIDLEAASGASHQLLPVPAVFLVGNDGVIRFVYSNPDYKQRLPIEALLDAARGLK